MPLVRVARVLSTSSRHVLRPGVRPSDGPAVHEWAHTLHTLWGELQGRMHGHEVHGPLAASAERAGCTEHGGVHRMQHLLTQQLEEVQQRELHRDMMTLPHTSPQRVAWLSADRFSQALALNFTKECMTPSLKKG